jgi:predicted nucleic-acid-binding protein
MTAFVDTNILARHLTGDPPATAKRATAFLASQPELYLADLIVAKTVYVLESFYKAPRDEVATAMRSLIAMRSMITVDPALLLRSIEVYEVDQLDFAEAYLVACAESAGVGSIASFDKAIDRVTTVTRLEP